MVKVALDFYSQEDALCDPREYLSYWRNEPVTAQYLGSFEWEQYARLTAWIDLCQSRGVLVRDFLQDTVLSYRDIAPALELLRDCRWNIERTPPLLQPEHSEDDAFIKMESILVTALTEGRGIIAICD